MDSIESKRNEIKIKLNNSSKHGVILGAICKAYNCMVLFILSTIYLALLLFIYLILKVISFFPIPTKWNIFLRRILKEYSLRFSLLIFSVYSNDEIYIIYDKRILENRRNIIVSNHLSDYDWLYIMGVMKYFGRLSDLYIILKSGIRKIPILNSILSGFRYIFVERKADREVENIIDNRETKEKALYTFKSSINFFNKDDDFNILVFPEGTYITHKTLKDAKTHAKSLKTKGEEPKYFPENVLFPKTLGFDTMTELLKDTYDGVVDITMFTSPYMLSIYDSDYTRDKLFVDRTKKLNFHFFIQYKGKKEIEKTFLHESFKTKQNLLKEYNREVGDAEMVEDRKLTSRQQFKDLIERSFGQLSEDSFGVSSIKLRQGYYVFDILICILIILIPCYLFCSIFTFTFSNRMSIINYFDLDRLKTFFQRKFNLAYLTN